MNYNLPHTIENGLGETIIFKEIIREADGEKLLVEGRCLPKAGPPMHVHYKQDEGFTVVQGRIGYQVEGEGEQFLEPGESVVFPRGKAHRFWNAGSEEAVLNGWLKPVNTIIFYLSSIYAAQKKAGTGRPEAFDGAYLLRKYKNEYDMIGIPGFVKNVIMPITYGIGKISGKYKKFKEAPEPLK